MANSNELKDQRNSCIKEMEALTDAINKEERIFSPEELGRFEHLKAEQTKLKNEIDKLERTELVQQIKAELQQAEPRKAIPITSEYSQREIDKEHQRKVSLCLNAWFKGNYSGAPRITPEENRACDKLAFNPRRTSLTFRSGEMGSTDANLGDELVAPAFYQTLTSAMKAYGGILNVAQVIQVPTVETVVFPLLDDTGSSGQITAEHVQESTNLQLATDKSSIALYNFDSKIITVSFQLLKSSAFPIAELVAQACGIRIGRKMNTDMTTGNGSSKPYGIKTGAYVSTVNSPGTGTMTYSKIVELQDSQDQAYNNGNNKFMGSQSTLSYCRKILDTTGRPLIFSYNDDISNKGRIRTLLEEEFVVNNDMPSLSSGNVSLLYGDFSFYKVLLCDGITLQRFDDSVYGQYFHCGYLANQFAGGRLIVANSTTQNPVVGYQV